MATQTVPPSEPKFKTFTDIDGTKYSVRWVTIEPGVVLQTIVDENGNKSTAKLRFGKASLLDIAERIIRNYYME